MHNGSSRDSLCVITSEGVLVLLPPDNAIRSITMERMLELIPEVCVFGGGRGVVGAWETEV